MENNNSMNGKAPIDKMTDLRELDCGRWHVKKESESINFDCFSFLDHVTNSKIVMEEARKTYGPEQRAAQTSLLSTNAEIRALQSCVSMLKTTKLFQKDSLRQKMFKGRDDEEGSCSTPGKSKSGRNLRGLIEDCICEMNSKELQKCKEDSGYKVNPQVMELRKLMGNNCSVHQILKVIYNIRASNCTARESNHFAFQPTPKLLRPSFDDFHCPHDLLEKAEDYLKNTIKENSTYLIQPPQDKQLYQQLHKACRRKDVSLAPKRAPLRECQQSFDDLEFKPVQLTGKLAKLREELEEGRKGQKQQCLMEKRILFAAANDLTFEVGSLLVAEGHLTKVRDAKGNTLLHISAKNRNCELFELVARRWREGLQQRNELQKTPQDLARIYGAQEILRWCELASIVGI